MNDPSSSWNSTDQSTQLLIPKRKASCAPPSSLLYLFTYYGQWAYLQPQSVEGDNLVEAEYKQLTTSYSGAVNEDLRSSDFILGDALSYFTFYLQRYFGNN